MESNQYGTDILCIPNFKQLDNSSKKKNFVAMQFNYRQIFSYLFLIKWIIEKKKKITVDLIKLIGYVWTEGELNASLQTICKKVVAIMHGCTFLQ